MEFSEPQLRCQKLGREVWVREKNLRVGSVGQEGITRQERNRGEKRKGSRWTWGPRVRGWGEDEEGRQLRRVRVAREVGGHLTATQGVHSESQL